MSKINQALSELASETGKSPKTLQRASLPEVKQRRVLPWLIAGFTLSMAVGGWSLTLQAPSEAMIVGSEPIASSVPEKARSTLLSPTSKMLTTSGAVFPLTSSTTLHSREQEIKRSQPQLTAKVDSKPQVTPKIKAVTQNSPPAAEAPTVSPQVSQPGSVHIEQVDMTPRQLATNAEQRAQKALDSNNLSEAISQYEDALRYMPSDEKVRQTLSALYYGKGETRKSADLLQRGIERNVNSQALRIALSKLLIKESQQQAALTPLLYLPDQASTQYLSLRAALAQKVNQDEIAEQSYQKLVEIAPDNGRWWMGLGIQQERGLKPQQALISYQYALQKLGLSSQSQQFIRQRLALLTQQGESSGAN